MKLLKLTFTGHQAELAAHALMLAFVMGLTFDVRAFCAYTQAKPNRHTRRVLNQLATLGVLFKAKALDDDGHYRMQYTAHRTKPLKGSL